MDEQSMQNEPTSENATAQASATPSGKNKKGVLFRVLAVLLCVVLVLLAAAELMTVVSDKTYHPWSPDYEKVDLTEILDRSDALTEEDYGVLYRQTGLTKIGVDRLIEQNDTDRIYRIQEAYFQPKDVVLDRFAPWTCSEMLGNGKQSIQGAVRTGDIIVTASTHVLCFRYGHAALVVNDRGTILESTSPGALSDFYGRNVSLSFDRYASFMILRPDPEIISTETRLAVGKFAREELTGIPYAFTVGIFSKKNPETLKYTQCAHIVWYAYKHFGIDLDSNGGGVVKPRDIVNSPYMQVVQIYGFNPDTLWQ